ncbi:FixH family protein [uncultured Cohaesibacter sp.]|uniref:FixH family protein n=1 Tax=uncultured Cohaesibacter sp. TaxID=1002546 RepID=UPI0037487981
MSIDQEAGSMAVSSGKREKKLTGWHVLLWLFGFFGVMFVVNGFFVYYARSTWPGVVEDSPYQASQNYNRTLAEAEAQKDRNWHMEMALKRSQQSVFLVLEAKDKVGKPLTDLTVEANVGRVVTEDFDHKLTLVASGDGVYQGEIGTLEPGRWRIKLEAMQDGQPRFQTNETIALQ